MLNIGVYLLKTPTEKGYVGMTCDSFENRWKGHLKDLRRGVHRTPGLVNAYHKYGWYTINKIVLEEWVKPSSLEELQSLGTEILNRERYWWEQLSMDGMKMLNGCPTGTGSVFHTEHTRQILGEYNRKKALSNPRNKVSFSEIKEIRELYEEKNVNAKEIARRLDKAYPVVRSLIKDNEWVKDVNGIFKNPNIIYENLLERFPIINWHFHDGKNAVEIANILGFSSSHISAALRFAKASDPLLDNTLAKTLNQTKVKQALQKKKQCQNCEDFYGITVIKTHERSCLAL